MITNPFFKRALDYVLENEKRVYTDRSTDHGGPTHSGVTIATLSAWRRCACSPEDVRNLQPEEIEKIYFSLYWRPVGGDKIGQFTVATAIFDCAVLYGPYYAAVYAQRVCKEHGFPSLEIDGHIGPKSSAALQAINPRVFIPAYCNLFKSRIAAIVAARPSDSVNRKGWENRLDKLLTLTTA